MKTIHFKNIHGCIPYQEFHISQSVGKITNNANFALRYHGNFRPGRRACRHTQLSRPESLQQSQQFSVTVF